MPFLHLDQAIARNGIEVIGGMTAATPGCAPERFNLFVFAEGKFAGTVASESDDAIAGRPAGAVRVTGADTDHRGVRTLSPRRPRVLSLVS